MSNLATVRSFEIVVALGFLAALIWTWRLRSPLYLGALLAGAACFIFDWAWCARSFFNATFNPDLIPLPGIANQGVVYPLALLPAWGLAFGLTTIMLVQAAPRLDSWLGAFSYIVVWLIGGGGMTALENVLVGNLHIYTYYQAPRYLIGVVPWSNVVLSGNLLLLCYVFLRCMQKSGTLPVRLGFDLRRESTWRGLLMGALPLWGAFVISYIIQVFWYGLGSPWIESGRAF